MPNERNRVALVPTIVTQIPTRAPQPSEASALARPGQVSKLANPVESYLAQLAPGDGRESMRATINTLARLLTGIENADPNDLDWWNLTREKTLEIRARLETEPLNAGKPYAPTSANKFIAALKGILRECWRSGLMSDGDYNRAVDFTGIKAPRKVAGRAISKLEGDRLFAAADAQVKEKGALGIRNKAILMFLYGAALRRKEASASKALFEQLNLDESVIVIVGKGNKTREVVLDDVVVSALRDWVTVRGTAPGPLFYRFSGDGKMTTEGLGDEGVKQVIDALAKAAGVQNITPHDLRRSYITDKLDAGIDISFVSEQVGHSSTDTTKLYDRRGFNKRRDALKKTPVR